MHTYATTYQTAAKEHDRDGNMLKISSSPLAILAAQMLEENIRRTIDENKQGFNEFGRRGRGSAIPHHAGGWLNVPAPAEIREAAHDTSERQ